MRTIAASKNSKTISGLNRSYLTGVRDSMLSGGWVVTSGRFPEVDADTADIIGKLDDNEIEKLSVELPVIIKHNIVALNH